jgi:hypothetical protein
MKELNKDWKRRDEIINGGRGKRDGGYDVYHFEGMTLKTLKLLFKENFIDPNEQQNCAPSCGTILKFMEANKRFTCHGYVVSPERSDYRVSIEGVELTKKPTVADKDNFVETFRMADEFTCNENGCYCWYD